LHQQSSQPSEQHPAWDSKQKKAANPLPSLIMDANIDIYIEKSKCFCNFVRIRILSLSKGSWGN
jgi:hypothetical protein